MSDERRPAARRTAPGVTTTSNASGSNASRETRGLQLLDADEDAADAVSPRPPDATSSGVAADGGDARAARARDVEGALDGPPRSRSSSSGLSTVTIAARPVRDAIDARPQIELGLDSGERRLVLGARRGSPPPRASRRARLARQRVTRLRAGLGAERRMHLGDPEPVQPRDALERAARLRHDLGADAVAGEARDVYVVREVIAATSSKTS